MSTGSIAIGTETDGDDFQISGVGSVVVIVLYRYFDDRISGNGATARKGSFHE